MASIIKPRRGTSAPTTGEINQNELAVDTTNKRIYIGAADGSGTLIGSAPAGSDTQVQFNDGGVLGGDSGLVYNKSTDTLTVGSLVSTGNLTVDTNTFFVDSTNNKVQKQLQITRLHSSLQSVTKRQIKLQKTN